MLLSQVRVVAALLFVGIGGGFWAWHAFAGAADGKGQGHTAQVPGNAPVSATAPKSRPTQPAVAYGLTGSVRVEGTGEPVPGAKFLVLLGDSGPSRSVSSGSDGRFAVDLPPGQARSWTLLPPAGYWAPNNNNSMETFVLAPIIPSITRTMWSGAASSGLFDLPGARPGNPSAAVPSEGPGSMSSSWRRRMRPASRA